MSWQPDEASIDAFTERHAWLSTSPGSGFVRFLTVQRRDATGADVLRGLVLKRVAVKTTERILESQSELFEVLGDLFGLDVDLQPRVK